MKQRISQEKVLDVIKVYIELHGYPPTNRELAEKNRVFSFLREWLPEEYAEGRNSGNGSSAGFAPCNSGSGDDMAGGMIWTR